MVPASEKLEPSYRERSLIIRNACGKLSITISFLMGVSLAKEPPSALSLVLPN
jgi:hypothetical protein